MRAKRSRPNPKVEAADKLGGVVGSIKYTPAGYLVANTTVADFNHAERSGVTPWLSR